MNAEFGRLRECGYFWKFVGKACSKIDAAIAFSLDSHIMSAYSYLMKYYITGDRISLFGYSRGGFTARVLAGMLDRVGLLNAGLEEMVSTAWEIHRVWENDGQPTGICESNATAYEFKKTFSRKDIEINFMGLWDCVNSVGIIRDRLFPYTSNPQNVRHIRHAISTDERRGKFKQNLFYFSRGTISNYFNSSAKLGSDILTRPINCDCLEARSNQHRDTCIQLPDEDCVTRLNISMSPNNHKILDNIDIIELLFAGDHGDVGSGWPDTILGHNLSNIPLKWILSFAIEFGVIFQKGAIHGFASKYSNFESLISCNHDNLCLSIKHSKNHIKPDKELPKWDQFLIKLKMKFMLEDGEMLGDDVNFDLNACKTLFPKSTNGVDLFPNPERKLRDPKCLYCTHDNSNPIITANGFDCRGNEKFYKAFFWWIIEVLPIGIFKEDKRGKWKQDYFPNFGSSRRFDDNMKLHWSVLWRMQFINDYNPKNLPPQIYQLFKSLRQFSGVEYDDVCCNNETGSSTMNIHGVDDGRSSNLIANDSLIDSYSRGIRTDIKKLTQSADVESHRSSAQIETPEYLFIDWNIIPDDLGRWLNEYPEI
ncbi:unnamed protein product [[Candida] boidinii]|uniref:Unnamed protein product n=1 Tax=Candida boidinii TaxID=5477 RepID=A0A9W6SVG3_CANBO|nr:hypothetical protein B5S30_g1141 [[Candida] boidinii]GME67048.1 unnamed protein product [[Candida] boidinii]GMF97858.1 unnamed protein product [[Candida] boidinii]